MSVIDGVYGSADDYADEFMDEVFVDWKFFRNFAPDNAAIAQLVEHFIRNEKVVGSSPTRGSDKKIGSNQTLR